MRPVKEVLPAKLKHILLPCIMVLLLCTAVYASLMFMLINKLHISLKEEVITMALPAILAGICVLLFLRPRFKLLKLGSLGNLDISFVYYMLATLFITGAASTAYTLLDKYTSGTAVLHGINEIDKHSDARYYTLSTCYIDKNLSGASADFDVSGKHNQHFDMTLYLVSPIYNNANDTIGKAKAWICSKYDKTISNSLSQAEKEKEFNAFAEGASKEYDAIELSKFVYLERVLPSDDLDGYTDAAKQSSVYDDSHNILLIAKNEALALRTESSINWFIWWIGGGLLLFSIMVLIPKTEIGNYDYEVNGMLDGNADLAGEYDFMIPKRGFMVTPIVVAICILLYIGMMISGAGIISFDTIALRNWGGNYGPYISNDNQYWRLLTSAFLHGGLMHLANNMVGLLIIGLYFEERIGSLKYLLVFVLTGIGSSLVSYWWHPNVTSIGASGAMFGLMGAIFAIAITPKVNPSERKLIFAIGGAYALFNLVMGFLMPGVDNAGHIGGLLSGFLLGLFVAATLPDAEDEVEVQVSDEPDQRKELNV